MKKVVLVLGLATLFSCQKEEIKTNEQSSQEVQQDCNCDRIVDVKKFYIVGDAQSNDPSGFYHCPITTINDCNKMQKFRSFNFKNEYSIPKVGDCYNMGY